MLSKRSLHCSSRSFLYASENTSRGTQKSPLQGVSKLYTQTCLESAGCPIVTVGRISRLTVDDAKSRRIQVVGLWVVKQRMVENVEEVEAELCLGFVDYADYLVHRHVPSEEVKASNISG